MNQNDRLLVDEAEIGKLADSCCLNIAGCDRDFYVREISRMLDFLECMNRTEQTEQTERLDDGLAEPVSESELREDEILPGIEREELLSAAAMRDGEYFLVPNILNSGASARGGKELPGK